MNSEFEQKLWELKNELESQRLQQVGTMKNVLERQHSKDMLEIDDVHQQQMEGLKEGRKMENLCLSWEREMSEDPAISDVAKTLQSEESTEWTNSLTGG